MIKYNLPPIPACKICYSDKRNPEIDAIFKCQNDELLTIEDEIALKEAIEFYRKLFPALKAINLSALDIDEVIGIQKYLDKAIDFSLLVRNDMTFNMIYRITCVDESFREKGKVRDLKYLKYPSVDIVKKQKRYNRANTFNKTVFYAASNWHIALLEIKPKPNQKIIMSVWKPKTDELFNSYPISNTTVDNDSVKIATDELQKHVETSHPLWTEILDLLLAFLGSEFVKDCKTVHPNRFEYLFSAYFSDIILGPIISDEPEANCDLIRYPSIAWNHKLDNIAMSPYCLDNKVMIHHAIEYEVEETYYEMNLPLEETPAALKFIREAKWFDDDLIIWEDE
ncbi:MAG: hypothetical protein ABIQ40_20320 [Bacteroidia bacterium]